MKLKIKTKLHDGQLSLEVIDKGEWIDLRASEQVTYKKGDLVKIDLGMAMKLPKGFEAVINPRSSTPKNFGLIQANCQGVIDNTYSGTNDRWMFVGYAFRNGMVAQAERICQFRIQLSQKATAWQKLKWMFTSGIEFEYVDELDSEERGGFGTTGKL